MGARGLVEELLDLVFPRRCVRCRAVGAWLCDACAAELTPLPVERCRRCGAPGRWAPSPGGAGGDDRPSCPECVGRDLAFGTAAAAFVYDGPARALVTACKFRSFRSLAGEMAALAGPAFAAAVVEAAGDGGGAAADPAGVGLPAATGSSGDRGSGRGLPPGPAGDDGPDAGVAVTWVPAHRTRTVERGFDQAELLARALAVGAGLPAVALLRRARETARQSGLHGAERAANVSDAFQLRAGADRVLTGFKRVVIVDDVYTTGETLNHCASVLSQAGADPRAFTFARAVRRSSPRAQRSPIPATSAHREAAFHAKERSR